MKTYEDFVAEELKLFDIQSERGDCPAINTIAPTEAMLLQLSIELGRLATDLAADISDYVFLEDELDIDIVDHILGGIEYHVTALILLMQQVGGSTLADILSQNMADMTDTWEPTDDVS